MFTNHNRLLPHRMFKYVYFLDPDFLTLLVRNMFEYSRNLKTYQDAYENQRVTFLYNKKSWSFTVLSASNSSKSTYLTTSWIISRGSSRMFIVFCDNYLKHGKNILNARYRNMGANNLQYPYAWRESSVHMCEQGEKALPYLWISLWDPVQGGIVTNIWFQKSRKY